MGTPLSWILYIMTLAWCVRKEESRKTLTIMSLNFIIHSIFHSTVFLLGAELHVGLCVSHIPLRFQCLHIAWCTVGIQSMQIEWLHSVWLCLVGQGHMASLGKSQAQAPPPAPARGPPSLD